MKTLKKKKLKNPKVLKNENPFDIALKKASAKFITDIELKIWRKIN